MPWKANSDNGSPFASRALSGLSRLAVWWLKSGILPERIEPGHPEQNGRHERMHRTLKQETARPPKLNRSLQQMAFDTFSEPMAWWDSGTRHETDRWLGEIYGDPLESDQWLGEIYGEPLKVTNGLVNKRCLPLISTNALVNSGVATPAVHRDIEQTPTSCPKTTK